jgi:hypothetical protein
MSIGVNWKDIWKPVWKTVWRQASVTTSTDDDKPKKRKRVAKLTVYKKPPAPTPKKAPRKIRARKPIKLVTFKVVLSPPPTPLEEFVRSLPPPIPALGELSLSLQGCGMKAEGIVGNRGRIEATLEGANMDFRGKVFMYDDALSIALNMPDLEPELIEL